MMDSTNEEQVKAYRTALEEHNVLLYAQLVKAVIIVLALLLYVGVPALWVVFS